MLIVTIQLANSSKKVTTTIGRLFIWNDGTGDVLKANYQAVVRKPGCEELTVGDGLTGPGTARKGTVLNFPKQSMNIWRLVLRALKSCYPEEN